MPLHRRLTAALAAAALGWTALTLGVATPAAQADGPGFPSSAPRGTPHDPATYYAGTEGLSGPALASRLNSIVDDQTRLSYAQVYDALPFTDEDPTNPANLTVFYSGTSLAKSARCGSGSCAGLWNREHTWPQSHGEISTSGPGADLHHMRPEFADTNSSRGNKDFDNGGNAGVPSCAPCRSTASSFEPRAAVKGDLARGLFYMAVRYDGDSDDGFSGDLDLLDSIPTSGPRLGRLSTLVSWSLADPPDARERARNDLVDGSYQHNRNPFIDHPEWVCGIWGSQAGAGCATPANSAPTTAPMTATTAEDAVSSVPLAATDADGDPLTWTVTQAPVRGSATVSGSVLTYTPRADTNGTDQIRVTVSDGRGGAASTTVSITVRAVNDAPVAANVAGETPSGTAKQLFLMGSDVDDTDLTYTVAELPGHGAVSLDGATATYTPATGYTGPDSFTYTVRDPAGATSPPATASLTVTAVEQPPTAGDTAATTTEDQPVTFPLPGSGPDGATLTYVATQPTHGIVTLVGDQATYTPTRDTNGRDSFTFTVSDGVTTSAPATASVAVTAVNDAPVVTAASATTPEDAPVVLTLVATDVDSAVLTYAVATQPAHGAVVVEGDRATYTPTPDFHGTDAFTWTVSDGSATTGTTTGTATTTVTPVNDRPTVEDVEATTGEVSAVTIPLAGDDIDGDDLTFATAGTAAHGTVEVAGPTATYTPAAGFSGTDTFTYTATDGTLTSEPASVTVTVTPAVNNAPTVSPAQLQATVGTPVTSTLAAGDPDGDPVTISAVSTPVHGSVTYDGTTITYAPSSKGADTVLVTVSDGRGGTARAAVDVTVVGRTTPVALVTPRLTRGTRATATIVVGDSATGRVRLLTAGRTLATAVLGPDGTARVSWTPGTAGVADLVATYDGDAAHEPARSAIASPTVARSASRTEISAGRLQRGRPGVVRVSVRTVAGAAATGTVSVTVGPRRFGVRLVRGVATVRVARLPRTRSVRVTARYAGDQHYAAGSATRALPLRR